MVNYPEKERYDYQDLCAIMRILRAPGGCVWDREQTHESIRRDFLEEVYEACEAIDEGSAEHLCEELGDVLLQVVFHADIAEEAGQFTQLEVCDGVCRKLIYRHPHVFGDVSVSSSAEVLDNWDTLKRQEKAQESHTDALRAVSRTLPALWRAEKLQHKAAKAGVKQSAEEAAARVRAAASNVSAAMYADTISGALAEEKPDPAALGGALGELLFAACGLCDSADLDPEALLNAASERFLARFAAAEDAGEPLDAKLLEV